MKKFIIALIGIVITTLFTGMVLTSCDIHQHYDDEDYSDYLPEDSMFVRNIMNNQSSYVYKNEDLFVEHAKSISEHENFISIVSTLQSGTIRAVLATLKNRDIPLTEKNFIEEYFAQQCVYDAVDRSLKYPDKELDAALDTQNPIKQEKEDSTCEQ